MNIGKEPDCALTMHGDCDSSIVTHASCKGDWNALWDASPRSVTLNITDSSCSVPPERTEWITCIASERFVAC